MPTFNFANVSEIDFSELLQPGEYNIELEEYDSYASQKNSNNTVHKFTWKVTGEDNLARKVWDYITEPTGNFKLKALCAAFSMYPDSSGNLNIDFDEMVGSTITAKLSIQKGRGINPNTGEPFASKNVVQTYIADSFGLVEQEIDIDSLF